ncbi:MAG TPA: hypothetical protein P5219_11570, partial [Aminivibrio sp.]|nr:hypothetical protein [Aminivibrio sp.]
MGRFSELDPGKIKTYAASDRVSKVRTAFQAVPPRKGMSVRDFLKGLPDILKAKDLLNVARDIAEAKKKGKPVIAMLGGHVIKCGCAPVLLGLAKKGFISSFASNGAGAIHDAELAAWGQTSEDVAAQLDDGSFGMASDTAEILNSAAKRACELQKGLGESLGELLEERQCSFREHSLAAGSLRLQIQYT